MNAYVNVLEEQFKYLKKIFESRKDVPDSMLLKEKDMPYNSPLNVISHAINNLYFYAENNFIIGDETEFDDLFEESNDNLYAVILEKYRLAIDMFTKMLDDKDFNQTAYETKISYLIMHTVQHIGQGIRLHKMNTYVTNP